MVLAIAMQLSSTAADRQKGFAIGNRHQQIGSLKWSLGHASPSFKDVAGPLKVWK